MREWSGRSTTVLRIPPGPRRISIPFACTSRTWPLEPNRASCPFAILTLVTCPAGPRVTSLPDAVRVVTDPFRFRVVVTFLPPAPPRAAGFGAPACPPAAVDGRPEVDVAGFVVALVGAVWVAVCGVECFACPLAGTTRTAA